MEDVTTRSTCDLLTDLIGKRHAAVLYHNNLRQLFYANEAPAQYENAATKRAHYKLLAARELISRCFAEELPKRSAMSSVAEVRGYLQLQLAPLEREAFICLFLDTRHRVLAYDVMAIGTIDSATVHPREIVKAVLQKNAAAVIFAHNHPSGITEPSSADCALTRRLTDALKLIDVRVLDHFVVSAEGIVSFSEQGLL